MNRGDRDLVSLFSGSLSDAAERLSTAASLPEFMMAIETHREAWREIRNAQTGLGHYVPLQLMEFCLDAVASAHRRLNDHQVESLIHIDRYVATMLTKVGTA